MHFKINNIRKGMYSRNKMTGQTLRCTPKYTNFAQETRVLRILFFSNAQGFHSKADITSVENFN